MAIASFDRAFEKQPSEQLTIRAEFAIILSNLVISGYALNAVEVKVFDSQGVDVTSTLVNGAPTIDAVNSYVFVTFKAGTDGMYYTARFRTTWTKGGQPDQTLESDLLIQVQQKGFA